VASTELVGGAALHRTPDPGESLTRPLPLRSRDADSFRDACLVCLHPAGPLAGARYPLGKEAVLIGRSADCRVRSPDPSVSRRHARVELRPGSRYHVVDLGSSHGTFVNDVRVADAPLDDGDYLRVAGSVYRFLAGGNVEADYHEELHRLTVLDPLTGVHNRRYLMEHLGRELVRTARYGRALTLILLDVDNFKQLHEKYGLVVADRLLGTLCVRVSPLVREEDLLARYAGEEFALVLPECDAEQAATVAARVRQAVAAAPFLLDGTPDSIALTVSLGVGVTPGGEVLTPDDLIARAEAKLREAEAAGPNRVVI
jgi:diguanylate cyclase (GGDEF)-like protein